MHFLLTEELTDESNESLQEVCCCCCHDHRLRYVGYEYRLSTSRGGKAVGRRRAEDEAGGTDGIQPGVASTRSGATS